jgi:hypothetical protein
VLAKTDDYWITAFDAKDGQTLWRKKIACQIGSATDKYTLIDCAGYRRTNPFIVETRTGDVVGRFEQGFFGDPGVNDSALFIASRDDCKLTRIDLGTWSIDWRRMLPHEITGVFPVGDKIIFYGRKIHALDEESGAQNMGG